ncbi:MAG: STT3 domain-containing protein [Ignisphaera sp.]|uniref:dolichyl-phosphooligosaccharide-protein glycotransferase n=1 Tax=Ignisphaera aggregans TaxID=334771 RepID=A0A7J3MZP5_9CREN
MVLSKIYMKMYRFWDTHSRLVVAIFVLIASIVAFWLRIQQYLNVINIGMGVVYPEAKLDELDPFVNYWIVNYMDRHGIASLLDLTEKNPATCLFWYPECRNLYSTELPGHLLTIYFLYQFVKLFGVELLDLMALIPPILGTLGVIFTALAVKELTDSDIASIISALAYALVFLSREVAGFTVKYSFGLFTAPLVLWRHIRLLKKPNIVNSVLAGLAIAYAASVWTGVGLTAVPIYVTLVLAPIFIDLTQINNFKKYTLVFAIEIAIPTIAMISMKAYHGGRMIIYLIFLITFAFYIFGAILSLFLGSRAMLHARKSKGVKRIFIVSPTKIYITVLLILVIAGATILGLAVSVPGFLHQLTRIIPVAGKILLGLGINPGGVAATVAEYRSGGEYLEWYMVIHLLLLIFILIPTALYDAFKNRAYIPLIFSIWAFLSWYATYNTVYFSDYTKVVFASVIGYSIGRLLLFAKPQITYIGKAAKIKIDFTKFIALLIVLSITIPSIYLAYASSITYNKYPMIVLAEGFYTPTDVWISALRFLQRNTSQDSLVISWWDYGYWLSVIGNRSTVADGATINSEKIQKLARFFTNSYNETYRQLKDFGVCSKREVYIVIFSPVDVYIVPETKKLFIAFPVYPQGFGDIPKFISAIVYLATGRWAQENLTYSTSLYQFDIYSNEWINHVLTSGSLGQKITSFVSLNIDSERVLSATLPRLFMWSVSKALEDLYPSFEQTIVPTLLVVSHEGRLAIFSDPLVFGYSLSPTKLNQDIYDIAYTAISQPIELSNNMYRYVFVSILKPRDEFLNIICS